MKSLTKYKSKKNKWDEKNYILVYKLALEGLSKGDMAETLAVPLTTFNKWLREKDGLAYAFAEGKKGAERIRTGSTLQNYIFGKLTPKLRRLWRKIKEVQDEPNSVLRINRMFAKHGEDKRKELFLHVLSISRFNPTEACKKLCISKATLDSWVQEDLNFSQLISQIDFHKGNFCEGKLMELVDEKNPQVAMFVAKTLLKGRGYGEKIEIEHSGKIVHEQQIDVTQLSIKLQKAILQELRINDQVNNQQGIIEGTVSSVKALGRD